MDAIGMGGNITVMLLVCVLLYPGSAAVAAADDSEPTSLTQDFYNVTCPRAEKIVRDTMDELFHGNPGLVAGLLRVHFHDCFVQGCDASILLDATPSGDKTEKQSSANGKTLHGLEVIDEVKRRLEEKCPGVVSCADVVSFAVRDAVVSSGLPFYEVPSGRRDGLSSLAKSMNLPSPFGNVDSLTKSFASRGLTLEEMVTLTGAHSVGVAHCPSFESRLNHANFRPPIGILYANYLRLRCPPKGSFMAMMVDKDEVTVDLTPLSSLSLGNKYYLQILRGKGLLMSDQVLAEDARTRGMVKQFAFNPGLWANKFTKAMQKLGTVGVLVGNQGEVRRNCRQVN